MSEVKDMGLGLKVRRLREIRDYSQSYMADKLSIAQSKYSDLESGKKEITDDFLNEIAAILEVHPDVIRNYSDQIVFQNCTQSGYYNTNNINDLEPFDAMYKTLMQVQEARIAELKIALDAKDKLIALLEATQKKS